MNVDYISEIGKQFIFESICYFAKTNETVARQLTIDFINRQVLTDDQIIAISNILKEYFPEVEESEEEVAPKETIAE